MMRLAIFTAVLASACAAPSGYYGGYGGTPQYASAQTTTQSTNGDQTTTSTTTQTFESYEHQEATPPAPPVQPASYEPPPPPVDDADPRCDRRDTPEMCVALGVILDIGHMLERLEDRSCGKAAKALNRYADSHDREIDTMLSLQQHESPRRLQRFQERHADEARFAITQGIELDNRCDGDERVERALDRVGFHGFRR